MKSISLPNKVTFEQAEGNRSVLVIEPLYPGYGVTLGNALRRVLLSSLPGAAVVAVRIKGVDHEFSTVSNIREDVLDIVLNLKQLRLKLHREEPVTLKLTAKGEKEVKASEIEKDADVEIVNPDLVIATLDNKDAKLDMEIVVQQGRGYVPVEMREDEKLPIGTIAVDAVYSPVRNVNFEVQHVRVGQITNYDKLTITMETDGTVTGEEALDLASEILVEHFSLLKTDRIAEIEEAGKQELPVMARPVGGEDEELGMPAEESAAAASDLDELNLSNRAMNALHKNEITSIAQLEGKTAEELSQLEGLGAKSVEEILQALAARN